MHSFKIMHYTFTCIHTSNPIPTLLMTIKPPFGWIYNKTLILMEIGQRFRVVCLTRQIRVPSPHAIKRIMNQLGKEECSLIPLNSPSAVFVFVLVIVVVFLFLMLFTRGRVGSAAGCSSWSPSLHGLYLRLHSSKLHALELVGRPTLGSIYI